MVEKPALDVGPDGRITYFGPAAQAPPLAAEMSPSASSQSTGPQSAGPKSAGPNSAASAAGAGSTEVRDLGGLLMPGLVNTHAHSPMTLVRGAGDGLPLLRWLHEAMFPREGQMTDEDIAWGMTLGTAEMLRAGITTTCEMYLWEDAAIAAGRAAGIRLFMCPGVIKLPGQDGPGWLEKRISAIADVHKREHDPNQTVTIGFGPHSIYSLGPQACGEVAAAAAELDALLHIHVAETREEGAAVEAEHGGASTVQILAEAGVFVGRTLTAHSVWLNDADLATYVEHDVAVAHCPISNMKLGSGTARVVDMLNAGITVSLATDGPASNDDLDLWEEIKMAPLLARVSGHDATAISAATSLSLATSGGAKALGLDVGQLAAGRWADFIRVDLDNSVFVPVTSPDELVAHVAWSGSSHVSDVWVAGNQVVQNEQCVNVDESQARAQVQQRAERIVRDLAAHA